MWSPLLMTQPLCPYPPVNPLKVIPVLAQDETLQVTTSVPGSPVQQAFHPAVRSRIRKYPVSAPETVFPMPRQRPVISNVEAAMASNGPTVLIVGVQVGVGREGSEVGVSSACAATFFTCTWPGAFVGAAEEQAVASPEQASIATTMTHLTYAMCLNISPEHPFNS
jgi:hypothetical protein